MDAVRLGAFFEYHFGLALTCVYLREHLQRFRKKLAFVWAGDAPDSCGLLEARFSGVKDTGALLQATHFVHGTVAAPYPTVGEANNLAWSRCEVRIKAGSYAETLTLSTKMTVVADGGTAVIGEMGRFP